jgi:hypothetical protein
MIKVGLVDIDTSHAASFAKILRETGDFRVTHVFDKGQVRSDQEVDAFCNDYDCRRCGSVDELADRVDAAMVLSADWDVHLARLTPLLQAGKPTFIDKPLAGNTEDLATFVKVAKSTATPVLAGSGWRYNLPIQKAHKKYAAKKIDNVLAMMHRDFMYYGIHAVGMVLGLLGSGIETVFMSRHDEYASVMQFTHRRGTCGYLQLNLPQNCFNYGVEFTVNRQWQAVTFKATDIHRGVFKTFMEMVNLCKSPLTPEELTEPAKILLAALQSWEQHQPVRVADLKPSDAYPSTDFMKSYISP